MRYIISRDYVMLTAASQSLACSHRLSPEGGQAGCAGHAVTRTCMHSIVLQVATFVVQFECKDFYCATCMHSADYDVARCLSVRPSLFVRLSDTRRYSV